MARFDLIIQNNASRQAYVFPGLEDLSDNHLYHKFNAEIEAEEGEYTYVLIINDRDDVTYDIRVPLLDTILHTEDGDVVIRDLQPATGLLRIGAPGQVNTYDNTAWSGETTQGNNTMFFYEG